MITLKTKQLSAFKLKVKFVLKKYITSLLKPYHKRVLKNVSAAVRQKIKPGEDAIKKIENINLRLYCLGIHQRALADLNELVKDETNKNRHQRALRELALWFANQGNKEGYQRSLKLLSQQLEKEKDPDLLRQTAIMIAESYLNLGDLEAARATLNHALAVGPHADLYFSFANLESSIHDKMAWVNKAFALHGLARIAVDASISSSWFDRLQPADYSGSKASLSPARPKISVIMPAYNAEDMIMTAINSVLSQTWSNFELLVADDGSTDATASIVSDYAKKDSRIKLIRNEKNRGAYAARNRALIEATGEYVTCHDTDDWSHPEILERQARHLLNNRAVIGNTSKQVRATSELVFYRRTRYGILMFMNFPSFMFRRRPVLERLGFWDSVRFSADHELIRRIKIVFGEDAVLDLPTGPLCFQREHPYSLTSEQHFGSKGYYMGARKEYYEGQSYYHRGAFNLKYKFPQESRPFPVPEPMWEEPEKKPDGYRYFDVIIVSDFRLPEKNEALNVQEIIKHRDKGLKVGLISMYRYDLDPGLETSEKIRALLDGQRVQMLVYGEKASCDDLIISHYLVLLDWQEYIPEVKANEVHVIIDGASAVNQEIGNTGDTFSRCAQNLQKYFGKEGLWHPLDAATRKAFPGSHAFLTDKINISEKNWLITGDGQY